MIYTTSWIAFVFFAILGPQSDQGIELTRGPKGLDAFVGPTEEWAVVGDATLDPTNPRRLTSRPGEGTLAARSGGSARNLVTRDKYTDVAVHLEFLISRGSNSGIKLMGLYEIQIADSFGKKELTGSDCGGIYPRGEELPRYHVIDKGSPPRVNSARPAGEWQTLDIAFRAPRFDTNGRKIANAWFLDVVLNGQRIHENVELYYPTGGAWRQMKEVPTGPLLLQGDHGPVAFRNLRVKSLVKPSGN